MISADLEQRISRLYAINLMREKAGKEKIKLSDILHIPWSEVERITEEARQIYNKSVESKS